MPLAPQQKTLAPRANGSTPTTMPSSTPGAYSASICPPGIPGGTKHGTTPTTMPSRTPGAHPASSCPPGIPGGTKLGHCKRTPERGGNAKKPTCPNQRRNCNASGCPTQLRYAKTKYNIPSIMPMWLSIIKRAVTDTSELSRKFHHDPTKPRKDAAKPYQGLRGQV